MNLSGFALSCGCGVSLVLLYRLCLADLFFVILTLNKRKYLKFCHTKYDNTKSVLEVVDESAYGLIKFDSIHKKAKWIAKNFDITLKEIENDKAYKMRQKGE